ncbi:MAG: saccharopine dehydrogenase NADP-binding domain-containing protein [Thermoplasmata archaeon]|nr:saccharopine dehydrogenase NADP-binding domain-containing protein [Thermoplasmata archaeon]
MKKVLVLGAGMVSRPLVRYLLDNGFHVTVASRTVSKAEALVEGHPNGEAIPLNVKDEEKLEQLISEADLSVSLLPYVYHPKVARYCIKHRKHMVTTSYVSDEMKSLDGQAREAGVLLLNEIGLDPGIDHMSAMRIIHDVQNRGGRIASFQSCCGALPAHQSNTNPFGYKFSWAPRGVLLASRNSARFRKDGRLVEIPGEELFEHYDIKTVPGVGDFENYPNRNSVPYADLYGITDADTVYRGTFRFTGWSETMRGLAKLGYLDDTERPDLQGKTYRQVLREIVGDGDCMACSLASYLGVPPYAAVVKRLEWLELTSDDPVPEDAKSMLDLLASKMFKKLALQEGDIDMCVLFHEFIAEFPDGRKEYITSTLVDYGQPDGDTAIARTVSLPAAIAVRMILEGKISLTGVYIPVVPEIYEPVLDELENMGIRCVEKTTSL